MLTQVQYARHRGVSKQAVARAVETGRIPTQRRGGRKLIDPAIADVAWVANTDQSKPRNSISGRPKANGHAPVAPTIGTLAYEQLLEKQVKRAIAQLELDRRQGRSVNAEEAEARFFQLARDARNAQIALADRLAPELMAITDLRAFTLRLREELTKLAGRIAVIPDADHVAGH